MDMGQYALLKPYAIHHVQTTWIVFIEFTLHKDICGTLLC